MTKKKTLVKPVLKSFNCRSCGATLDLTAVGLSVSIVCPSCQATLDANDPNFRIISQARSKYKVLPSIPIGSRGKLSGKVYEVIGFMERAEGIYPWKEYLLYNPYVGFRWLFEMNGHWSFIKRIRTLPEEFSGSKLKYKGKTFKLFNNGNAEVKYVEGEFYWRVKVAQRAQLVDFISPPYMLSREVAGSETTWTLGTYITPERLEKAFKLEEKLIEPHGIGANQPSPVKGKFKEVFILAMLSFAICLIIQVTRTGSAKEELLISKPIEMMTSTRSAYATKRSDTKPEVIKTESFDITADGKNVKLKAYAEVNNSWVYFDTLLVNELTGKGIPIPVEISYYRGSDWSEGSKRDYRIAYNVPAGRYYLSIQLQVPLNFYTKTSMNIKLISDSVISSNLYWILAALFFPLIFVGFRSSSFEKKRWANGSENPYGEWDG